MSKDDLKQFFGDKLPPADALADLMQREVSDLAGVLSDVTGDRKVLICAIVFDDEVVDRICTLGHAINKQQAHDAEIALSATLMHQSEEDGEA
jgi:hypothetical protein